MVVCRVEGKAHGRQTATRRERLPCLRSEWMPSRSDRAFSGLYSSSRLTLVVAKDDRALTIFDFIARLSKSGLTGLR